MKYRGFSLAYGALALTLSTPVAAQVVYQSVADMSTGAVDNAWCAACGDGSGTQVEDKFTLENATTLTGINLWVYASGGYGVVTATGYTLNIYSSDRSTLLYSQLVKPVVTLDFRQGKLSQELLLGGAINALMLDAGSYWAGFHADRLGTMGFAGGDGGDVQVSDIGGVAELNDNAGYQLLGRAAAVTQDAVPEPTSWALMVAGFGLVGASVRRRRSVVKFA